MWDWVIRARRVNNLLPMLENVLAGFGQWSSGAGRDGADGVATNSANLSTVG